MSKEKTSRRAGSREPSAWIEEPPVGQALRDAYQEVVREPVPERLQVLIRQLREQDNDK